MDYVYFKLVILLQGWVYIKGSPLAMFQHPTSSQSIVFHQPHATSVSTATPPSQQFSGIPPKYEYKYEVSDHETGDRKSHWESRDGDRVRGIYTLYEPDGALRTVEYSADALHGFNAVVKRNEPSKHQHKPIELTYKSGGSNGYHDSYPSSGHSRHATGYTDPPGYSGKTSSFSPGVGFSVDHSVGLKKLGENTVKPF